MIGVLADLEDYALKNDLVPLGLKLKGSRLDAARALLREDRSGLPKLNYFEVDQLGFCCAGLAEENSLDTIRAEQVAANSRLKPSKLGAR